MLLAHIFDASACHSIKMILGCVSEANAVGHGDREGGKGGGTKMEVGCVIQKKSNRQNEEEKKKSGEEAGPFCLIMFKVYAKMITVPRVNVDAFLFT